MNVKRRILVACVLLVFVAAPACARDVTTGGDIDYSNAASDLVLRIDVRGGLLGSKDAWSIVPAASLFGDGTLIGLGAQIEIFPPPALPPLVSSKLSTEAVGAILGRAESANLLKGNRNFENDRVMDAPTTEITINADGETFVTRAYALGIDPAPGETKPIADFVSDVVSMASGADETTLPDWMPKDAVSGPPTTQVRLQRLQIVSFPAGAEPPEGIEPQIVDWPLASPLSQFGEPLVGGSQAGRCAVVDGPDAVTLFDALERANQLTRWKSEGLQYEIAPRPLMPDEKGCVDELRDSVNSP